MPSIMAKITRAPRQFARNTSVAARLSLVVLLVALVSLVITSFVGLSRGSDLADDVLSDRQSAIAAARADEVERYISGLQRAAIGQAISPGTATAIGELGDVYRELQGTEPSPADETSVDDYYRDVVAPHLSEVRGRPVIPESLIPSDNAAVQLQATFVVPGDDVTRPAGALSQWIGLQTSLDDSFEEFAIELGVDDFYLIEAANGTIVYSTAKDIDFATSLSTGPLSGSALSVLIRAISRQPEAGTATIADYTSYTAAGDEPSLFIASPVVQSGTLSGFVALRIGPDQITAITTDDASWDGVEDSSESYLAASDDLMRSNARGFIENETAYLDAVSVAGTATSEQIESMRTLETTVLFQPVDDEQVEDALGAAPTVSEGTNYLGRDVLSASRSLDIDGLEWALFSDVEVQEVEQPVEDFVRNLLIAIAVFIVGITFLAVRWSDRLLQPLRITSTNLRAIRGGSADDAGSAAIPESSPAEFVALASDIDKMLATLAARSADAADRTAERRELLNKLLPPQIAQRAEAGDRDVVDQVPVVTVVEILIRGLGSLMQADSRDHARSLLDRFVEETDALAKQRGLDRIRLTGDAYVAACGTSRPHLDHAARAVSFVLDVLELFLDLVDEDPSISMSAGLHTGPVTVGLTGGSRLVYDAWGSTVQRAADLAGRAGRNELLVSAEVRSLLPPDFLTVDVTGLTDADGVVRVSGRASEGETVG